MNIPPGQNAFTYKPKEVFTKEERVAFGYSLRGVNGGAKRAMAQKGQAVYGLKSNPDNAPPERRKK